MDKNVTFWILIASVIVVLIACAISVSIIVYKVIKLRNKVRNQNYQNNEKGVEKVLSRKDLGELLWALKPLVNNPLDDNSLEFTINTIIRNDYKMGYLIGSNEGYELLNIAQKTNITLLQTLNKTLNKDKFNVLASKVFPQTLNKIKIVESLEQEKIDFLIILDNKCDWKDIHDQWFKYLNKKGMIFFYNNTENAKNKKSLFSYLKLLGIRHEEIKINNGIILVVKI